MVITDGFQPILWEKKQLEGYIRLIMANHQLTRRQKEIIVAMKQGAILWHPYIRASSSFAYLVSENINEQVKYSTVNKLIELGVIEEIEDENLDVNYRLKQ